MKRVPRLAFAALLLSCGSLALATPAPGGQDQDHDQHGHHQQGHDQHEHDRGNDHGHGHDRHDAHGRDDHRGHERPHDDHYYSGGHYYDHGHPVAYRSYHHRPWARGYRYEGPRYYVNDYGYYHLRRPPSGYRWVRSDNNFLLVALTTGVILDIASH